MLSYLIFNGLTFRGYFSMLEMDSSYDSKLKG